MTVHELSQAAGRFLTEPEYRLVEALFSQLVPGDPDRRIPGAAEAGAAEYLTRLLALDPAVYFEIPQWRTAYRDGLSAIAAVIDAHYTRLLSDLTSQDVLDLLTQLSTAALPNMPSSVDQKRLFELMRRHCIQGCFADPRWGGNRDKIMWRWFGYLQPAEDV